ncbi:hypothetical protein TNIN_404311 [Trichonephila inaurata madagascariensis]|uniref:Uncharacterized protein n=1 Tax=Trichonephila inaurata madagascariensis TaxID=2747483 RepID=A0A8X6YW09_9ARAC|nr:hypothetical protein TNIN_404311 [Trichonephila inaurata madagascariensis]
MANRIGFIHFPNLSVNFTNFGVPRIEKSDDRPYLAYGRMLGCFKHFKLSSNKRHISQGSGNAFSHLPITQKKARICLN